MWRMYFTDTFPWTRSLQGLNKVICKMIACVGQLAFLYTFVNVQSSVHRLKPFVMKICVNWWQYLIKVNIYTKDTKKSDLSLKFPRSCGWFQIKNALICLPSHLETALLWLLIRPHGIRCYWFVWDNFLGRGSDFKIDLGSF